MQTHSQRMRDIVKQDNARRAARILLEDATLGISMVEDVCSDAYKIAHNTKPGSYVPPCLVRGVGTVNPPMPTMASRNQWDRLERQAEHPVGVAPGTEDTAKVPTVLVTYASGVSEIRPVSSFRKSSKRSAPRQVKAPQVAETALHSPALKHDFTS